MRTRERGDDVQVRITRLEAAVRRINPELTALGAQLRVLSARVDRIMDGTANALTDAAARAEDARWR
jgi:hypothetical protein